MEARTLITLEIAMDDATAAEVRDFLAKRKKGQIVLHIVHGEVMGADCQVQTRKHDRDAKVKRLGVN